VSHQAIRDKGDDARLLQFKREQTANSRGTRGAAARDDQNRAGWRRGIKNLADALVVVLARESDEGRADCSHIGKEGANRGRQYALSRDCIRGQGGTDPFRELFHDSAASSIRPLRVLGKYSMLYTNSDGSSITHFPTYSNS